MIAVGSSSEPANFTLIPHRPPILAWVGWCRADSAVLGGIPFACSDFRCFRAHGPRMRIDDLSAPSGRFAAIVSAVVTTADCRPGRGATLPAADTVFASVFAVPYEGGMGSAEAPAAVTAVAHHASSPMSTSQGVDSAAITDPAASASTPPGNPAAPPALPPSGRIFTRMRLQKYAVIGTTPPAVGYGFGPRAASRPSTQRAKTPQQVLPP